MADKSVTPRISEYLSNPDLTSKFPQSYLRKIRFAVKLSRAPSFRNRRLSGESCGLTEEEIRIVEKSKSKFLINFAEEFG
jgi:hypothetical protein